MILPNFRAYSFMALSLRLMRNCLAVLLISYNFAMPPATESINAVSRCAVFIEDRHYLCFPLRQGGPKVVAALDESATAAPAARGNITHFISEFYGLFVRKAQGILMEGLSSQTLILYRAFCHGDLLCAVSGLYSIKRVLEIADAGNADS